MSPADSRKGWYKLARILMRPAPAIIAVALAFAAAVPMGMHALDSNNSDSMDFDLPRGTDATRTYNRLETDFGQGAINPFTLMLHFNTGNITTPNRNFQSIGAVIQSLVNRNQYTSSADILTPVVIGWQNGTNPSLLPPDLIGACLDSQQACESELKGLGEEGLGAFFMVPAQPNSK